jgi:hypothetical protein
MQQRWKKIDYTSPAGAQGGPGISKSITPYVGTPYIDMTAAVFSGVAQGIGATPGDVWWLGGQAPAMGGNAFMFVKSKVALTLGQLVTYALPTTGSATVPGAGTAASPLTTTASITTNISNAGGGVAPYATVAVNADVDNWIFVNATGATLPQLRRIKANSSSTTSFYKVALTDFLRPNNPTDADVFDTLATNADPLCIIRPWDVIVNTASTAPMGVALGSVTAGNFTIIQVAGLASVLTTGTGTALAPNVPAVGSANGVAIGSAAANQFVGGSAILPQIANAAAGVIIPCFVNFLSQ